jgi:omega-6 fatty acid desaturase (delta-12 desaturase)
MPPETESLHRAHPTTDWRPIIAPYLEPDTRRALIQLANTAAPYCLLMTAILASLHHGLLIGLSLIPAAVVLLVRLAAFQHDCSHGSFFPARWANEWLGSFLGVLTFTPFAFWRMRHAVHHATSGNLDRRGIGDVETLTVAEYFSLSPMRRLGYRLYRHPLILFGLGPPLFFLFRQRVPTSHPLRCWRDWVSIIGTDAALAAVLGLLYITVGPVAIMLGVLPVVALTVNIGVWLIYVQHNFDGAYWEHTPHWQFQRAALQGASFYDLPAALRWVTGNLGFHHIHHLAPGIPNYRLHECYSAHSEFRQSPRIGLRESIGCTSLTLWDSDLRKLVPFPPRA